MPATLHRRLVRGEIVARAPAGRITPRSLPRPSAPDTRVTASGDTRVTA